MKTAPMQAFMNLLAAALMEIPRSLMKTNLIESFKAKNSLTNQGRMPAKDMDQDITCPDTCQDHVQTIY